MRVLVVLLAALLSLAAPALAEEMVIVVLPVNNQSVEAAAAQARLGLSPQGTVLTDERTSRIIVKDYPANIEQVKALLKRTDVAMPMVSLAVDYGMSDSSNGGTFGVTPQGVVVLNGSSATSARGEMKVVTMSGSEAVLAVGEQVPIPVAQFFFGQAAELGLIPVGVVFQDVTTGFGVVPRVVGADEIVLQVYPRVAYRSAQGDGVIRFMQSASTVRARNGQTVVLATPSRDDRGLSRQIFATGRWSSSSEGSIRVTPTVMR